MIAEVKKAFETWKWSLAVLARSPAPLLALVALAALWGLAAYEWLWMPESSVWVLLLSLVWALVQILVAVAVVTGTATSVSQAAIDGAQRLPLRAFVGFRRRQLVHSLLIVVVSFFLALLIARIFAWVNHHSIEVASFLTFHSRKPVSHLVVEKIYRVLEGLLWIVMGGFLLSFLITGLNVGWQAARKQCGRVLANCCYKTSFLTGLLSVAVFGGLSHLLAYWRPNFPVGFWDYSQLLVRITVVLILLASGWLFWLLSLARLNLPSSGSSPT